MKILDKCTGEVAGSSPVDRAEVKTPERVFLLYLAVTGLERERGRGKGTFPVEENSEALETVGF